MGLHALAVTLEHHSIVSEHGMGSWWVWFSDQLGEQPLLVVFSVRSEDSRRTALP
jgi:hypothetical protein